MVSCQPLHSISNIELFLSARHCLERWGNSEQLAKLPDRDSAKCKTERCVVTRKKDEMSHMHTSLR